MSAKITVICITAFMLTSCFLPAPHWRLHEFGVKGRVVDAGNHQPLSGAVVTSPPRKHSTLSSATGEFTAKPVYGWHGAYLFGPIARSYFPRFDLPTRRREIVVHAQGYESKHFTLSPFFKPHAPSRSFLDAGTIEMNKAR